MYPDDDDEAKAELYRVIYSEKIQERWLLSAGTDDFDFRHVKSKWKTKEDSVTTTRNAAAPPPLSAVQRFLRGSQV